MKHFYFYLLYSIRPASAVAILMIGSFGQDSNLRIIEQPKPVLPENHGSLDVQGSVVLKVEFLANAEIGNIRTVVKMPVANLTELAIKASKKIRFVSEVKDGKNVVTHRLVRYQYSWDGFWKTPVVFGLHQSRATYRDEKAEAVLQKAIQHLGGEKYLNVKSQVGRGKYSLFKDKALVSFQAFVDVIVFPDKERTEFKGGGKRTIQVNSGSGGWIYDGEVERVKDQTDAQVKNFKQGIRTSLDNLLRGGWRGEAELTYVGRRQSTLGKRNDVIKLTYTDGFAVEFEFAADDGTPAKATYSRTTVDNEEIKEEDRYAQFVDVGGIRTPFIIDRFTNGLPSSRINYETVEFNKTIPDSAFAKPSNAKDARKDLKF